MATMALPEQDIIRMRSAVTRYEHVGAAPAISERFSGPARYTRATSYPIVAQIKDPSFPRIEPGQTPQEPAGNDGLKKTIGAYGLPSLAVNLSHTLLAQCRSCAHGALRLARSSRRLRSSHA